MKVSTRTVLGGAVALALCWALPTVGSSNTASDTALSGAIQEILQSGPLSTARVGVYVEDLSDKEEVYSHNPDVLLNPASNMKLFTTAAALALLGPGFRFDTEFFVDGPTGKTGSQTLYVRGRGDPTLLTERLWAISGELLHAGVHRVRDLVVDDSYFDGERIGPGFDQENGDRSYLAPTGALSLNWNCVAVYVGPGNRRGARANVELEPSSSYFSVKVQAVTVRKGSGRRVKVTSTWVGDHQQILVEGRIPLESRTQALWRRIDQPSLYFGETLKSLLELRGVKVEGKVRSGQVPQGLRLVHLATSETLAEVVRRLNKTSNNFVAEQILKTLGAQLVGPPGSWEKGVTAVEGFLADAGIARGSYVMKNGSGLNDANRVSTRQLVKVLDTMWSRFPLRAEYEASLPVAGRDGTLRFRLDGTEAAEMVRAKTGTLDNVTSLSGYVETRSGRTLAFALVANDFSGRPSASARGLDAIADALASSGAEPGALGTAVALSRPPARHLVTPASAVADLPNAVKTYYALGNAADPRNVSFLRTALRSETDPALRLAIGEAIYLSDPDGDSARRAFLDVVAQDESGLARLFFAVAVKGPPPVLSSLSDLAAEGTKEAQARMVEIAGTPFPDGPIGDAVDDSLASAAAGAPEEFVVALHAAPRAEQDLAIAALVRGVKRSDEEENPLLPSLEKLASGSDDLAVFARNLASRIEGAKKDTRGPELPPTIPAAAVPSKATMAR